MPDTWDSAAGQTHFVGDGCTPPHSMTRTVRKSCSWCDEMVTLSPDGAAVLCPSCGHRGDVSRMDCTCERCTDPRPRNGYFFGSPDTSNRLDVEPWKPTDIYR